MNLSPGGKLEVEFSVFSLSNFGLNVPYDGFDHLEFPNIHLRSFLMFNSTLYNVLVDTLLLGKIARSASKTGY